MKTNWRYWLGVFLLAAGLFAGCGKESIPQPREAQGAESQEVENSRNRERPGNGKRPGDRSNPGNGRCPGNRSNSRNRRGTGNKRGSEHRRNPGK